jgi:hypothetical protein
MTPRLNNRGFHFEMLKHQVRLFISVKVFLNHREMTIFKGATIRDVVLAYSKSSYKRLISGYLNVYDRFGFQTEPDGPVMEGQHFYLKVKHLHG